MEINKAIEILITHITNILQSKNNNNYDQRSINGFKNGAKTSTHYTLLISQFNDNQPMNTNNIDSIILKAYYAIPFDQLEEISFIYLQHSIEKQLFLYTRFEEATLNRLKTIFKLRRHRGTKPINFTHYVEFNY